MRTTIATRLGIGIAACAGAALVGCTEKPEPPKEPPRNVRVLNVQVTDLDEYLVISGPVRPMQATDISTEEPGVVERVAKDKGSLVRKGELIVLLDRDLIATEVQTARADSVVAAYNEERTQNLFDANSVSAQEMLLAASQLAKAEAHLDAAKLRYRRAAIKSPYAGLVVDRQVEVGQYVIPGMVVARVVDPYTLKLTSSVTEREVVYLEKDAPVLVTMEGVPGPVEGRVRWVGFEADQRSGKFPVEVHLDNSELTLRPGVVGRGRILKRRHRDAIVVPRDAIVQGRDGPMVYVAHDTTSSSRNVELGADQGVLVIVTAGLEPGEQLIVRGQRDITDGDRIEVQEVTDAVDGGLEQDPHAVRHPEIVSTSGTSPAGEGTLP